MNVIAVTIGIAQFHVRNIIFFAAPSNAQNVGAALSVARVGHRVRMVGSDHMQCVFIAQFVDRQFDRFGEFGRFIECDVSSGVVVRHIDAAAFDKQEKSILVFAEYFDRFHCHLRERGYRIRNAVNLIIVFHMRIIKKPQHRVRIFCGEICHMCLMNSTKRIR